MYDAIVQLLVMMVMKGKLESLKVGVSPKLVTQQTFTQTLTLTHHHLARCHCGGQV